MIKQAALWWTDNGAVLCTDHLGATARYSGRDISGQKIQMVSSADRVEAEKIGLVIRCEVPSCKDRP